jgi:ABC-type multidrug transport system ATPase subunit
VDAHVGKALFENAILRLRDQGQTVLLVTHALHFVPRTDYIYTLVNGRVSEEGTYEDLIKKEGPFFQLMKEFGGEGANIDEGENGAEDEKKEEWLKTPQVAVFTPDADTRAQEARDTEAALKGGKGKYQVSHAIGKAAGTGKLEGRLMISEKRTVGSIGSWGE